jgi:hypothetical protein
MPQNRWIEIKCSHAECHWNIGNEVNNCACKDALIDDKMCQMYITKTEADKRLRNGIIRNP